MATRYVGIGGSDANSGLTWALRKLTLNGVEDTPVVAGDTVYVGPGTYRELLTVDVSGSAGNPITYIGDFLGTNTDGVGGPVRITGSDNDQTEVRANAITATSKNYRTFKGFTIDLTTGAGITLITACGNWIIENCYFGPATGAQHISVGGTGTTNVIRNCYFTKRQGANTCILFTHSATVSTAAHVVENCFIFGGGDGIASTRVGGITIRNCLIQYSERGVRVATALAGGQTITVNNCTMSYCTTGMQATATGEIVENYNSLFDNGTNLTSVTAGANSNAFPPLLDTRWFFEMVS